MIASTTVDYVAGRRRSRATADGRRRRAVLRRRRSPRTWRCSATSSTPASSSTRSTGSASAPRAGPPFPQLGIVLPIGISFYTFNSMSYTIDIYRRRGRSRRAASCHYAAFVSMFPHLIAGPIVRYSTSTTQLARADAGGSRGSWRRSGLFFLSCGLVKKLLIADTLAPHVDRLFARHGQPRPRQRLGGGGRLRAPALLRLLRLLRHGGRARVPARLPVPAELRLAVQGR